MFALRRSSFIAAVFLTFAVTPSGVEATSPRVQVACAGDYFRYCSKFGPETGAARHCMDVHGAELSKRCVAALIADGEVSKKEVAERAEDADER